MPDFPSPPVRPPVADEVGGGAMQEGVRSPPMPPLHLPYHAKQDGLKHAQGAEDVPTLANSIKDILKAHQEEVMQRMEAFINEHEAKLSKLVYKQQQHCIADQQKKFESMLQSSTPVRAPSGPELSLPFGFAQVESARSDDNMGLSPSMSDSASPRFSKAKSNQSHGANGRPMGSGIFESEIGDILELSENDARRFNPNCRGLEPTWEGTWKDKANFIVAQSQFDMFFGLLIVLNSAFMGVQVELPEHGEHAMFLLIEYVFVFAFAVEISVRMYAKGVDFFVSLPLFWNYFDLIIVMASLVEAVIELISALTGADMEATKNVGSLRLVRILRAARLVRLLRMAKIVKVAAVHVRALRILIHSVAGTITSLVWAMVLLMVIMYFFGLIFTQGAVEHLLMCALPGEAGSSRCKASVLDDLSRMWGTIPRSMYTLFCCITSGIDWNNAVQPLAVASWMWLLLFLVYICFAMIAVMNTITGVFCQSAIDSTHHDRELMIQGLMQNKSQYVEKIRTQFQTMFDQMDNGAGEVTVGEFSKHLRNDTVQAYFALLELEITDAWVLFKLLDSDCSGSIDAEEFVDGCLRLKGQARSIDLAKMRRENKKVASYLSRKVEDVTGRLKTTNEKMDRMGEVSMSIWSQLMRLDSLQLKLNEPRERNGDDREAQPNGHDVEGSLAPQPPPSAGGRSLMVPRDSALAAIADNE
eukprot:TRINITY_DN45232_c0_g1_i1.p1 TRINITY_DN45232_c0_g1~~TRINITY_DN45232_c0_g1_i1.p1  ORF type:complete len:699 (-),score=129.07 TRINITY_DN45232_c0_g1_i1:6-2102(-)